MAVCQIYAEVELADLPVREGKEAKGWLTSAHEDAECAREHIGAHIRKKEELKMLCGPDEESSSLPSRRRKARGGACRKAEGASTRSRKQARDAAAQARLQASRTPEAAVKLPGEVSFTRHRDRNEETIAQGTFVGGLSRTALRQIRKHAAIIAWMRSTVSPTSRVRLMRDAKQSKRSRAAGKEATGATRLPERTKSERQEDPTWPHALNKSEAGLADMTSGSDISDPGGMPQFLRRPTAPSTRSPKVPRVVSHRQTAAQKSALKLTVAGGPQRKAREPPLLTRRGHKIRQEGVTNAGAILPIARKAGEENEEGIMREVVIKGAEERPTAEVNESPRHGQLRGLGINPDPVGVEAGGVRTPVPDQPLEGNDEFARDLASTMSAIASLVIRASGRSVSNGGCLYFSKGSREYRPFKAKCRLFQETYHKATPLKALVNMFREWNLAEEVAGHVKGAEDMPTAWRMLDAVYDSPPARTMDQMPEAGRASEPQEKESGEESEAGTTSEGEPAPLQAKEAAAFRIVNAEVARPAAEATNDPQEKHVFIYTLHGIRRLRHL